MISRNVLTLVSCLILVVLVAACGSTSAGSPTPTPRNGPTPVPSTLIGYASLAEPTLKISIEEVQGVLKTMVVKHAYLPDVANNCGLVGGDLSNFRTSFKSSYIPTKASSVYNDADTGFKLVLAALDECGIAADSSSRSSLKTATSDLKIGLGDLTRAEARVSQWYQPQK